MGEKAILPVSHQSHFGTILSWRTSSHLFEKADEVLGIFKVKRPTDLRYRLP